MLFEEKTFNELNKKKKGFRGVCPPPKTLVLPGLAAVNRW